MQSKQARVVADVEDLDELVRAVAVARRKTDALQVETCGSSL